MRVLWTVNALMPSVANEIGYGKGHAISWVDAMSKKLKVRQDIKLAMATTADVKSVERYKIDSVIYYLLPLNCGKVDYWDYILNEFKPDIIHAYGTEHNHNILLFKNHKNVPIIGSLQGILTEYQHHYYGGIDVRTMLRYSTFQDLFSNTGFFTGRRNFIKRSKNERAQLMNLKYVEGRSTWDRVSAMNINPNLKYFYCPRMIREPFYTQEWSIEKMERHSLFVSQALTPLKGLHFVLMAVAKLRRKYPDIKLYVAGYDRYHPTKLRQRITCNGYVNYIKHLMRDLNLENQVCFTGILDANQMAAKISSVNAVIIPSSIENAPNSLAEAEIAGTPCIATFVGGNMDMLEHNKEGYLYCYNEPNMLAEYISQIFDSDELATKFSQKAKATARLRHNPEILESTLLNIYSDVIKLHQTNDTFKENQKSN